MHALLVSHSLNRTVLRYNGREGERERRRQCRYKKLSPHDSHQGAVMNKINTGTTQSIASLDKSATAIRLYNSHTNFGLLRFVKKLFNTTRRPRPLSRPRTKAFSKKADLQSCKAIQDRRTELRITEHSSDTAHARCRSNSNAYRMMIKNTISSVATEQKTQRLCVLRRSENNSAFA